MNIEHGLVERQQALQSTCERLGVGGALAVSDRATALCSAFIGDVLLEVLGALADPARDLLDQDIELDERLGFEYAALLYRRYQPLRAEAFAWMKLRDDILVQRAHAVARRRESLCRAELYAVRGVGVREIHLRVLNLISGSKHAKRGPLRKTALRVLPFPVLLSQVTGSDCRGCRVSVRLEHRVDGEQAAHAGRIQVADDGRFRFLLGLEAGMIDVHDDHACADEAGATGQSGLRLCLAALDADFEAAICTAFRAGEAPRWWTALRDLNGMGSRALEFMALTAARSGEARGAKWDEIDLIKGVWMVPAARMKMKCEHSVPLPVGAIEMLKALPRSGELVFPAARGGEMSDVTPIATMKRLHEADLKAGRPGFFDKDSGRPAVPHGLRTTFRVWARQRGFSLEHAELALAHQFGDAVEQAYQRDIYTEQRRPMMEAWAAHLAGREGAGKTVELRHG